MAATAVEPEVQVQRTSEARGGEVVRVAVAGATGYAGRELIAILRRHPWARIARLMSSGRSAKEPFSIEHSHPSLRGPKGRSGMECHETRCTPLDLDGLTPSDVDLVFLATPHETSENCAAALLDRGLHVIDLSGAFRVKDASAYPRWYGFEHHASKELAEAVYGLTELNAAAIRAARLVGNWVRLGHLRRTMEEGRRAHKPYGRPGPPHWVRLVFLPAGSCAR